MNDERLDSSLNNNFFEITMVRIPIRRSLVTFQAIVIISHDNA